MLHILYSAAARWRRRHAGRRRRLARPVISIGNLAVGGRAKTPMADLVARALVDAGERPAILSRGYGRERAVEQPVVVRDADGLRAGLAESGDEPLMLAEHLDGAIVVVAADRARAGIVAESLGATVHVLDDGFQHVRMVRDVDIVMLHPADLNDAVMPLGRLREPVSALEDADAIVIVDHSESERALAAQALAAGAEAAGAKAPAYRIFTAARRVSPPPADLAGQSCVLVLGIAGVDHAAAAIRAAGWLVETERRFKDHHRYSARDAEAIARDATAAGAAFVLTSAKDAVRLREVWTSPLPLHIAELRIDLDEPQDFARWLIEGITQARAGLAASHRRARQDGARRAS